MSQMTVLNTLQIERRLRILEEKYAKTQINTTKKLSETDVIITGGLPSPSATGLKSLNAGGFTITNIKDIDGSSQNGDTVNYKALKENIPDLSGVNVIVGNTIASLDMNNKKLPNLANPTLPQDAATKIYVDTLPVDLSGITLAVGDNLGGLDINGNILPNVATPIAGSDAVNKTYVDPVLLTDQISPETQQITSPSNTLGAITFGSTLTTPDIELIDSQSGNSADVILFKTPGIYTVIVDLCIKSATNGFRQYLVQPTSTLGLTTTPFEPLIVANYEDEDAYQSARWESSYIVITPATINTELQFLGGEIGSINNPADMYLEQYDIAAQVTLPILTYAPIPTARIRILKRET